MVKLWLVLLVGFLCIGCASLKNRDVQTVNVPVMYCPAPEPYDRPNLYLYNMDNIQINSPGEVAKRYKASIQQLQGYTRQLELQLDNYKIIHNDFEEKKHHLFKGKLP